MNKDMSTIFWITVTQANRQLTLSIKDTLKDTVCVWVDDKSLLIKLL